jgi:hypothetical protein
VQKTAERSVQLVMRIALARPTRSPGTSIMISIQLSSSVKTSIGADALEALLGGGQTEKSGLLKFCETSDSTRSRHRWPLQLSAVV